MLVLTSVAVDTAMLQLLLLLSYYHSRVYCVTILAVNPKDFYAVAVETLHNNDRHLSLFLFILVFSSIADAPSIASLMEHPNLHKQVKFYITLFARHRSIGP